MGNDLSEKISSILSDEESLRELKELADMLTSTAENDKNPQNDEAESFDEDYSEKSTDSQGLNGILNSFKNESSKNSSDGFDMGEIMKLIPVIQGVSESDRNRNFLLALRPFLSYEKQKRLDKAVKLLKIYAIYKAVKESGINLI